MVETTTILLSLNIAALVVVAAVLIFRRRSNVDSDKLRSELTLAVNDRLASFEQNVRISVDAAKDQVMQSGVQIQQNAVAFHQKVGALNTTIEQLVVQQKGAQELAKGLQTMLQGPKLRGNYGEQILEEMLARVLPAGIWHRQYAIDGRETVDAVVEFKGIVFPIDAKFPRDDYERYVAAKDDDTKRRAWKAYETAVRTQIASIASKYIKPEKGTSEFALMFIPSEAIYYETIAHRNSMDEESTLYLYAQEQRVIPVSPNTFFAFLQVILVAVNNVDLLVNAKKIQEGMKDVEISFEKFYERFEDVGKNLVKAAEAYDVGHGHVNRFKQRVDKVLNLEFEEEALPSETPPAAPAVRLKSKKEA